MKFSEFIRNEDGAITVDWVMLTAGVVVLSIFIVATINDSLATTATEIALVIDSAMT